MRSGFEILEALDKAAKGLQMASSKLSRLSQDFLEAKITEDGEIQVGVGLQFDTQVREEKIAIYQAAIAAEQRPPAEDLREAMALKAVEQKHPKLWVDYHGMKAQIDALKMWVSNEKQTISANQSLRKAEAP